MKKERKIAAILVILIAILYVTIFSSTSLLYDNWYPLDSTIYQIIGKGWTEGIIPYVDLWDQKGPFLYSINALGYWSFGNKFGIYVIETIVYSLFFLLSFNFFTKYYSVKASLALLVVVACHLSQLMAGGNNIEQYVLPALMLSLMHVWGWAINASSRVLAHHSWRWAFFYGVILSACMLSRLTNAIGICVAFAVILVYLCYFKRWRDLGLNILGFGMGFFTFSIPFWVYFYLHDGLYELLYATILFNVDYFNDSNLNLDSAYELISKLLAYVGCYGLLVMSILLCFYDKAKWRFHAIWFAISALTLLYCFNTAMLEHYAIIAVPYFAIMMVEYKCLYTIFSSHRILLTVLRCTANLFVLIMLANGGFQAYQSLSHINMQNELLGQFERDVLEKKGIDKSQIIGYGLHPSVYLHNQITPVCRFFALQDSYASHSESLKPKVISSYEQTCPKYILLSLRYSAKDPLISGFIHDNYYLEDSLSCGFLFVRDYR